MSDMGTMPIPELITSMREQATKAIGSDRFINGMVFNVLANRLQEQLTENDELRGLVVQAIGWTWADACVKTADGVDITKHEIPELIVRIQKDIPEIVKVFHRS